MESAAPSSGAKPARTPRPRKAAGRPRRARPAAFGDSRWKRRGTSKAKQRMRLVTLAGLLVVAVILAFKLQPEKAAFVPEGAFPQAVYDAFPEADPHRIATAGKGDLPNAVSLHMPAHMIAPALASDPFLRLGNDFGGAERSLSGTEMAARIEQIANAVLPADVPRCYTYETGGISSAPDAPRATRTLYLWLNPGC